MDKHFSHKPVSTNFRSKYAQNWSQRVSPPTKKTCIKPCNRHTHRTTTITLTHALTVKYFHHSYIDCPKLWYLKAAIRTVLKVLPEWKLNHLSELVSGNQCVSGMKTTIVLVSLLLVLFEGFTWRSPNHVVTVAIGVIVSNFKKSHTSLVSLLDQIEPVFFTAATSSVPRPFF